MENPTFSYEFLDVELRSLQLLPRAKKRRGHGA
jgi:hypothetical protein